MLCRRDASVAPASRSACGYDTAHLCSHLHREAHEDGAERLPGDDEGGVGDAEGAVEAEDERKVAEREEGEGELAPAI